MDTAPAYNAGNGGSISGEGCFLLIYKNFAFVSVLNVIRLFYTQKIGQIDIFM